MSKKKSVLDESVTVPQLIAHYFSRAGESAADAYSDVVCDGIDTISDTLDVPAVEVISHLMDGLQSLVTHGEFRVGGFVFSLNISCQISEAEDDEYEEDDDEDDLYPPAGDDDLDEVTPTNRVVSIVCSHQGEVLPSDYVCGCSVICRCRRTTCKRGGPVH